ncbi:glycosyltransferase family 2 protein [Mucilaginibacter xinganensis]|uniref:Alpha-1,3-L-rhamnosyltransferase n=1 Tax=Mucilaginibacter xinganensis TaxID=1234841 RepID=A0A223NUU8_9SPHI|nr:glycosyltransferase family 2 protein [Mucilaginibacter xinganensis]ASU33653.1 alpha-1,3-L-rhamnosyltransferase [Mucilaginibacter xinganensis]
MNISVCIATYNGEKYIREQLESIIPQLPENGEIIISDDSSTDKTLEIIESINDNRIKVFSNQKFRSPIFNFENAIIQAQGKYIFLADQDDKWFGNKIEVMLNALKDHDLVVSNAMIGDESLNIIKDSYFAWRNSRTGFLKNLFKNSYLGCCIAFDRKLIDVALPFPENIPMHDMWIGMVAEMYFKPIFIPNKLMIYRRHGNNVTPLNTNFTSNNSLRDKISFRYNLLVAVIKRSLR